MPPQIREPFGLVALQTAQMGRPIVASDTGGLPEVVEEGVSGLLVPRDNAKAFADATASLLANPESAQTMGRSARACALTHFSWSAYIEAYDALMQRLISSSQAGSSHHR